MSECLPLDNLPDYIPWIHSIFGTCVYGYRDAFSLFFGYFSIFCWLNSHIPQIKENYQLKSGDGLSIYYLFFCFASDIGNTTGCFLNHQMFSQKLLQIIFLVFDIILISQYFYYQKGTKEISVLEDLKLTEPNYGTISKKAKSGTMLMGLMFFGMPITPEMNTNSLISGPITFGLALAWTCVSLDIISRFPQIIKNFKRHSVEGLSKMLFVWAMLGNFSYGASIALHPGRTALEFSEAFPYIFCTAVTLTLDILIFSQYIYYTKQKKLQASFV